MPNAVKSALSLWRDALNVEWGLDLELVGAAVRGNEGIEQGREPPLSSYLPKKTGEIAADKKEALDRRLSCSSPYKMVHASLGFRGARSVTDITPTGKLATGKLLTSDTRRGGTFPWAAPCAGINNDVE